MSSGVCFVERRSNIGKNLSIVLDHAVTAYKERGEL
jgi:hypothetical protein